MGLGITGGKRDPPHHLPSHILSKVPPAPTAPPHPRRKARQPTIPAEPGVGHRHWIFPGVTSATISTNSLQGPGEAY